VRPPGNCVAVVARASYRSGAGFAYFDTTTGMCQYHDESPANFDFAAFCGALRRWLNDSPELDPPLAAAIELLDRRPAADRCSWFECEVTHIALHPEDMHAALGAGVVLSLWNASRVGRFSIP